MRNYLQHGSRHRPTGTDPIPGLGGSGLPWALLTAFNLGTVATGTTTTLNLQLGGGRGVTFDTSDSSMFALADGGGGKYGLQINENGLYIMHSMFGVDVNSTPAAGSAVSSKWLMSGASYLPIDTTDSALFVNDVSAPGTWHSDATPSTIVDLDPGDVPAPIVMNLSITQNSGLTSLSVTGQFICYQINPTGSPDF